MASVWHQFPIYDRVNGPAVGWMFIKRPDAGTEFYWRYSHSGGLLGTFAARWLPPGDDVGLAVGTVVILATGRLWPLSSGTPPAATVGRLVGNADRAVRDWVDRGPTTSALLQT